MEALTETGFLNYHHLRYYLAMAMWLEYCLRHQLLTGRFLHYHRRHLNHQMFQLPQLRLLHRQLM